MVVATQFIFSLAVAVIVGFILHVRLRRRGQRTGLFFFVLLLFLIIYAGGLWIKPFGPSLFGVFWLPIVIIGFLVGLFYYQAVSREPPHNREETLKMLDAARKRQEMARATYVTLDLVFWLLICLLLIVIFFAVVP